MDFNIVINQNGPQFTTYQYWIEVEEVNAWFVAEKLVVDANGVATVEWEYRIEWWVKRHLVGKKIRAREPDIIEHCKELLQNETIKDEE